MGGEGRTGWFEPLLAEQCAALEGDLGGEGGVRLMGRSTPEAAGASGPQLINAACQAVGLRGIGDRWRPADRRLLELMLRMDQIHSADLRTPEEAAVLAGSFLSLLDDAAPELWCNFDDYADGTHAFTPVSGATFNLCLAAVAPERVAMIWLDQEE